MNRSRDRYRDPSDTIGRLVRHDAPAAPPARVRSWTVERDMIGVRVTVSSMQYGQPVSYRVEISTHFAPQVAKKVGDTWIVWCSHSTPGNVMDLALTISRDVNA